MRNYKFSCNRSILITCISRRIHLIIKLHRGKLKAQTFIRRTRINIPHYRHVNYETKFRSALAWSAA